MVNPSSQQDGLSGETSNLESDAFIRSAGNGTKAPLSEFLPYIITDAVFLGVAFCILALGSRPLTGMELVAVVFCVSAGAISLIYPFKRRLDHESQAEQAMAFKSSVSRLSGIEDLASRIEIATSRWTEIESKAEQSLSTSKEISEEMIGESESFKEFIRNASSEETQHLRLMVEKLKKAEKEWVHIIMAMMDHATALKWAAQRSSNPNLIQQITNYHSQLVEIARQVGLVIYEPSPGEVYDSELHQPASSDESIESGDNITVPRSAGFKFRGVILRKALVSSKPVEAGAAASSSPDGADDTATQTFDIHTAPRKHTAKRSTSPASSPAPNISITDSDNPEPDEDDSDPQQSLL